MQIMIKTCNHSEVKIEKNCNVAIFISEHVEERALMLLV